MRIIARYIVFDLLKVLVLTLVGMTLLMIFGFVAKEAADEGLGPASIARLLPYILPEAMRFTVPGTVLLAMTSVFGRMAASNEIVALKSLGISPWKIITPALVLATFISFATVWLNDVAVSWGHVGMKRVVLESLEEIAYRKLSTQRSFSASGVSISVRGVSGKKLLQPTVIFRKNNGESSVTVVAREAELAAVPENGTVRFVLRDWRATAPGERSIRWPGDYVVEVSLEDFSRSGKKAPSPSNYPLASIPSAIRKATTHLQQTKDELAIVQAFSLVTGDFDNLSGDISTKRQDELVRATSLLARLGTEPHRRWANGFCCLSFALVGIPMAIRGRRREFLASFFACFLPVLGAFYPMLFLGIDWAKHGLIPPVAVWTGNVVFAMWGWWLMRRVIRY